MHWEGVVVLWIIIIVSNLIEIQRVSETGWLWLRDTKSDSLKKVSRWVSTALGFHQALPGYVDFEMQ